MPIPFHIIDGYNLLHAAGLARLRYGPGDLERCRNRLLGYLRRHLPATERNRTTVVFDAADAPPDRPRQMTLDGMTVLFAVRGGDADTEIERLIAAHSAPRQVRVVSSDHRLQKAARRRRAVVLDSDAFLDRLERRGPVTDSPPGARPSGPKYGGSVAPRETEHWLAVFGDALTAAEPAQDQAAPAEASTGRPAAAAEPASPPLSRDEIAFWQARVAELLDESVDRPGLAAENPREGSR
jgi:uncharacterized protein